jgi:hypothetical protein
MKYFALVFGILGLFVPLASEALSPGEGIVLDRNTGDYIISYANPVGRLIQSRFVPSTKIDPTLRTRFEIQQGLIHYRYAIKNGSRGKQPLILLIFDPVSSIHSKAALPGTVQEFNQTAQQLANDQVRLAQYVNGASGATEAPNGWSCDISPNGITARSDFRIGCSFDDLDEEKRNGLQVGNTLSGFGFYSMDLPGIGIAQLYGFGDRGPGFEDEGPDGEISDQLEVLMKNDHVPRNAAVPAIAVPAPFDAAVLLDRIRTQIATWPSKQLIDPVFAAQLDRSMVAAANAFRSNQLKAGREHIESLRKLLDREHKFLDHDDEDNEDTPEHKHATRNTIDRLAARVLDFDLRYVLKRMEHGHEHEHGEGDRSKER